MRDKSALSMKMLELCKPSMRRQLEIMTVPKSLDEIIGDGDAKTLLKAIEGFAIGYKNNGAAPEQWTQMRMWKKLSAYKQQPRRTIEQHCRVFLARCASYRAIIWQVQVTQRSRFKSIRSGRER